MSTMNYVTAVEIQFWPIERLVFYARNPWRSDAAVDRMCSTKLDGGERTFDEIAEQHQKHSGHERSDRGELQ